MLTLLLAAAAPQTAVDAERAFAAAAQKEGQWTAFCRYAADDAVMFTPELVDAKAYLQSRKDPPKSVQWSPIASYVSCDGKLTVNTGEWRRPDGAVGLFSTVWVRQPDGGWKWTVDGGSELKTARKPVATALIRHASCKGKPTPYLWSRDRVGASVSGTSLDGTIAYHWYELGQQTFTAMLWNGEAWEAVVVDRAAAPSSSAQSAPKS